MTDPHDRTLLDAVDDLTKPQKVGHWQHDHEHVWDPCKCPIEDCTIILCRFCEKVREPADDDVDAGKRMKIRTDLPLLDWLREAISSNIGGNGGGKQARERTPMDVGAFTLYEDIDGRIRSWMADLGATPGKDITPTEMLRSLYVLWTARTHVHNLEQSYQTILEGWATAIRDRLDPPKRIEITSPCPACGKEWHNVGLKFEDGTDDPDDVERVRVLNAIERETIEESYAICTACERVWRGVSQMRALRILIDDAERAKAVPA